MVARSRGSSRDRLVTGFMNTLPDELQALVALAHQVEDEEDWDSVADSLERLGRTAESLQLGLIATAASNAARGLGNVSIEQAFAPLMQAIRSSAPAGPFAPVAIVGSERQVTGIAQQDDGTCEPLQLFSSVADLNRLVVEWPQAIAIPAAEAEQVGSLREKFDCPVYVYGAARDKDARALASARGAQGFVAEPVVLTELLTSVRYVNCIPKHPIEVALLGPKEWSAPLLPELLHEGMRPTAFTEVKSVGSVLHSLFPDVVVLGPADRATLQSVVQMIRGHVGRTHVVILAMGPYASFKGLAIDGAVEQPSDLNAAIHERLARMRDHHRDRDVLTQLLNRSGILSSAQRALAWAERHTDTVTIGLVQAQGLARAADEHGMEAANACRRHLAIALERGLRRLDEVGYLGDDLFMAVLFNTNAELVGPRLKHLSESFCARAHADRRLREIRLSTAVVDTRAGVRGLLPRAMRQLTGVG